MGNEPPQPRTAERQHAARSRQRLADALPLPTAQFRRRAWLEFQRAIDPLAPPRRPPRLPRP